VSTKARYESYVEHCTMKKHAPVSREEFDTAYRAAAERATANQTRATCVCGWTGPTRTRPVDIYADFQRHDRKEHQ
jgi:hypothetical protein